MNDFEKIIEKYAQYFIFKNESDFLKTRQPSKPEPITLKEKFPKIVLDKLKKCEVDISQFDEEIKIDFREISYVDFESVGWNHPTYYNDGYYKTFKK